MDNEKADSVDAELFAGGEPTESDRDALLAQYQLFVQTSEALVSRRQGVNTFFLSVNSAILAVVGLLLRDGQSDDLESGVLVGLGLGGVALCVVWRRLMMSFGQLNKGKFDVIHALERRLPARSFAAEWAALGYGRDPEKYKPFTETEAQTPLVFGALQVLLVASGVFLLVQ